MLVTRSRWLIGIAVGSTLWGCGEGSPKGNGPGGVGTGANSAGGTSGSGLPGGGVGTGGTSDLGLGSGPGAGGANAAGGSAGSAPVACPAVEGLQVKLLATTSVSEMGQPFDSDEDDAAPWDWSTNYGKPPEIVTLPDGEALDILWQDHAEDWTDRNSADPLKNARKAFVVRAEKGAAGYAITRAYQLDQLARIMGFTRDEVGNYYVATGVDEDEDLTPTAPAEGEHRSGIVKLVKFDVNGCKLLEIDADRARETQKADSEPIINPMVAATSRLAYHGGRLALLHGINTGYDPKVSSRHQKALTTHFDANTGLATRTGSMWVSHSFDQRLFWDGTAFVELHLGDAFPRSIALGSFNDGDEGSDTYELFKPKGPTGMNSTFTRLGGIAPIAAGDFGYLVVFTTDRGPEMPTGDFNTLAGTRDLAFVRVRRDFAGMDAKQGGFVAGSDTQSVSSSGDAVSNALTWLTDYAGAAAQADRPRVAGVGADQFVVLWERWLGDGKTNQFEGVQGLVLGADGSVKVPAKKLLDRHIVRGDDLVTVGERALLVTGHAAPRKLTLHLVGRDLTTEAVDLL